MKPSKTTTEKTPAVNVAHVSAELQSLQRQRSIIIKSRNMQSNRLQAIVAGTLGYHSGMPEKDRTKKFVEASDLIKKVQVGEADSNLKEVILTTMIGINAFNGLKDPLEKEMIKMAKTLPVANWVQEKEQRGFGLLFLAIVIGETGDLAGYETPAKLWRRMGCAPWTFDGQTLMGATWRGGKHGKLPAAEWDAFGYSPRRRSIAYLVGEGLMKQNFQRDPETEQTTWLGPYRKRYDQAKVLFKGAHPDYSDLRCHRHGMLLATKLLLKRLWEKWNPELAKSYVNPYLKGGKK